MEFLIYVTKKCNIDCRYCSAKSFINDPAQENMAPDVEKTARLVLGNRNTDGRRTEVVFFGGEPLLNPGWIRSFMELTEGRDLYYTIQTNALLLAQTDPFILGNLSYLSLSIDGEREITDRGRGEGVYEALRGNLSKIRPVFRGKTLGRMTASPWHPLERSVRHILELGQFDFVYWQLENSPEKLPYKEVEAHYRGEIERLMEFWMGNLSEGRVLPIIPFCEVALSLLGKKTAGGYRCGAGSFQVIVDLDGHCYTCVELMSPEHRIGSIEGKTVSQEDVTTGNFSRFCKNCDLFHICGGRCLMCSATYQPEKFSFYCRMTRILVEAVRSRMPRIENLLEKGRITLKDLHMDFSTEEIP